MENLKKTKFDKLEDMIGNQIAAAKITPVRNVPDVKRLFMEQIAKYRREFPEESSNLTQLEKKEK